MFSRPLYSASMTSPPRKSLRLAEGHRLQKKPCFGAGPRVSSDLELGRQTWRSFSFPSWQKLREIRFFFPRDRRYVLPFHWGGSDRSGASRSVGTAFPSSSGAWLSLLWVEMRVTRKEGIGKRKKRRIQTLFCKSELVWEELPPQLNLSSSLLS